MKMARFFTLWSTNSPSASRRQYHPLPLSSADADDSGYHDQAPKHHDQEENPHSAPPAPPRSSPSRPTFLQVLPWILTLTFMTSSVLQYGHRGPWSRGGASEFPLARPTDFKPLQSEIETEIVTFTSAPVFMENRTFYVPNPGEKTYIGEPSAEIDENWEEITAGRYFRITAEEATNAFGSASNLYWNDKVGGYMAGIDMFHALHCLNRLRQAFWPNYYPQSTHHNTYIHREHCIDHIRQMLMCHGDMTLIPTEWTDFLGRNYVNSDVPHTCRNFGKLRSWVVSRHNGSRAVPESDEKHHAEGHGLNRSH